VSGWTSYVVHVHEQPSEWHKNQRDVQTQVLGYAGNERCLYIEHAKQMSSDRPQGNSRIAPFLTIGQANIVPESVVEVPDAIEIETFSARRKTTNMAIRLGRFAVATLRILRVTTFSSS
jgi:hypothetical protein